MAISSYFISANAGSGKTYSMINKLLEMLLLGVEPCKILCITYTNTGAGEIKERLISKINTLKTLSDKDLRDVIIDVLGLKDTAGLKKDVTKEQLSRK